MTEPVNFADPEFEPTDEQLHALMAEAFAGVKSANDAALRELHRQIAEARHAANARPTRK